MKTPDRNMSKGNYKVKKVIVINGDGQVTLTPFDNETDQVELYYSSDDMRQEHYVICEAEHPDTPIRRYDGVRRTGLDFGVYAVADYDLDSKTGDNFITLRKKSVMPKSYALGLHQGDYDDE